MATLHRYLLGDYNMERRKASTLSVTVMLLTLLVFTAPIATGGFIPPTPSSTFLWTSRNHRHVSKAKPLLGNIYDDWRSDAVVDTVHLDEDNVRTCLDEFVDSDYGMQMFGRHDLPSSHGITGSIEFVDLVGPEVILRLDGAFWHRRETVLGRAAVYLNARIPEINSVRVDDLEELNDFEEVKDEFTGDVLFRRDKRAPDFNGDRETMEYQGIDPDVRGPFPQGVGGLRPGGSMINPA